MDDDADLAGLVPGAPEQELKPPHHGLLGSFRRRQDFRAGPAIALLEDEIGEGAADIDGHPGLAPNPHRASIAATISLSADGRPRSLLWQHNRLARNDNPQSRSAIRGAERGPGSSPHSSAQLIFPEFFWTS